MEALERGKEQMHGRMKRERQRIYKITDERETETKESDKFSDSLGVVERVVCARPEP